MSRARQAEDRASVLLGALALGSEMPGLRQAAERLVRSAWRRADGVLSVFARGVRVSRTTAHRMREARPDLFV